MNLLRNLMIIWLLAGYASCYFYPLCLSNKEQPCINYFSLPNLYLPYFSNMDEVPVVPSPEEQLPSITDVFNQHFREMLTPLISFYHKKVAPLIIEVALTKFFREGYTGLIYYFPLLQEEKKVKSDNKLYILFILGNLTIYLALYFYFSKKLYVYYKNNLRRQYLDKIRKIFKQNE